MVLICHSYIANDNIICAVLLFDSYISARSPAATTPATQLCCRPHPTACRDRRSALNSQVTATSGMEKCGPVTSVLAAATCNMADSTAARTGFSRPSVMAAFKPGTRSASGAIGTTVTAQWWWLVGEGGDVAGLITGLESQRLIRRLLLRMEAAKRSLILVLTQTPVARPAARTPSTCGFASAYIDYSWLRLEMISTTTNSHYIAHTFLFERLGECTFWTWECLIRI